MAAVSTFAAQISSRSSSMCADSQARFVRILQRDGKVLEFSRRLRCCQLLAAYPGHTVYLASGLLREEERKILPRDSFLELGQVYLLLPQSGAANSSNSNSSSSSLPFLISKEFMAKILSGGGSATLGQTSRVLTRSDCSVTRRPRNPPALRRARSGHWVASLSSIPEVAAV